eukprot:334072-Amphidinium_carterae.1
MEQLHRKLLVILAAKHARGHAGVCREGFMFLLYPASSTQGYDGTEHAIPRHDPPNRNAYNLNSKSTQMAIVFATPYHFIPEEFYFVI